LGIGDFKIGFEPLKSRGDRKNHRVSLG
jgi:hypothetical protein